MPEIKSTRCHECNALMLYGTHCLSCKNQRKVEEAQLKSLFWNVEKCINRVIESLTEAKTIRNGEAKGRIEYAKAFIEAAIINHDIYIEQLNFLKSLRKTE